MTGNNKVWRAPLAGLAAVAMLATMGVAAGTANAADSTAPADVTVTYKAGSNGSVSGTTTTAVPYNDTLADAEEGFAKVTVTPETGYKFVGFNGFDFDKQLTANADVTAQFAADDQATTVKFENADGTAYTGGQFREGDVTDGTIYVAKNNGTLEATRVPVDKADGTVVVDWKVTIEAADGTTQDKGTVTTASLLKDGYKIGRQQNKVVFKANNVSNDASTITFNDPATSGTLVVGAKADGTPDADLTADVVKDGPAVLAPAVTYTAGSDNSKLYKSWTYGNNNSVAVGAAVSTDIADATELTASEATAGKQYEITFNSNGGSAVASQYVAEGGFATKPADPTLKGQTFKGWKAGDTSYNSSKDGYFDWTKPVKKALTLTAEWAVTDTITVTFHAGDYKDAPKDVTVEVAGDGFIDSAKVPSFTREGYTYDSWFVDKNNNGVKDAGEEYFDIDTQYAASANDTNDFTLVPDWKAADENKAKSALEYVTLGSDELDDKNNNVLGSRNRDDSEFFTEASWTAFKKVYKAQYQKYVSAKYTTDGGVNKNEVSAKTSAEIVSALQDAWKDLRFTSANADTVLDNNAAEDTPAKVIYRLYQPATGSHLYTGDEKEILTLTNKYVYQGGWTLDKTNFRAINSGDATPGDKIASNGFKYSDDLVNWVAGTVEGVEFTPLVSKVVRFYNGREHLYTADPVEQAALLKSGWSQDSDKAAILVPALYASDTKVTRLFNPVQGLHLYTSNSNEIKVLTTQQGWVKDGEKSSFYAL